MKPVGYERFGAPVGQLELTDPPHSLQGIVLDPLCPMFRGQNLPDIPVRKEDLLVRFFEQHLVRKKLQIPRWYPQDKGNRQKEGAILTALGTWDNARICIEKEDIQWLKEHTPDGSCWIDCLPAELGFFSASPEIIQEILIPLAHGTRFFNPKISEYASSCRAKRFFDLLSQPEFNLCLESLLYEGGKPGSGDTNGLAFCRTIVGERGLDHAKYITEENCLIDTPYLKLAAFWGSQQQNAEIGDLLEAHLKSCYATSHRKYQKVCTPKVKLCSAITFMMGFASFVIYVAPTKGN
jgi:hypothetical protein